MMTDQTHHQEAPTQVTRNRGTRASGAFTIIGIVCLGDQRGRTLGYPTANLNLPKSPPFNDGVWTAVVQLADMTKRFAAVSIGHRPTYYGKNGIHLLEAYLLDFSGDLYGTRMTVDLQARLRPQRKFSGSEDLISQLDLDVQQTREWGVAHSELLLPTQLTSDDHPGPDSERKGRWSPVRRKARTTAKGQLEAATARRKRREELIAKTVDDLLEGAELTHQSVADRTGLPEEYLRWMFPEPADLRSAARRHSL